MRLINLDGRLAIESIGLAVDVQRASGGQFSSDVQAVYERWPEFVQWADDLGDEDAQAFDDARLGPPVVAPRQIFAIGLNYRGHAVETGLELPDSPMVFTKFASSITGPLGQIVMPSDMVDWEAELVVVIGRRAESVSEAQAWDYVAGLTVGQDISERALQIKPPAPQQFNLAKSFPRFAPLGPALVTPDEFDDRDDLEIGCLIDGEQVQKARTSDLIFSVPAIVSYLSSIVTLFAGDVIFTGTPAGIGFASKPQRFLRHGEELTTYVEGIGTMRHEFVDKDRQC